jgi:hypothetical protein
MIADSGNMTSTAIPYFYIERRFRTMVPLGGYCTVFARIAKVTSAIALTAKTI